MKVALFLRKEEVVCDLEWEWEVHLVRVADAIAYQDVSEGALCGSF